MATSSKLPSVLTTASGSAAAQRVLTPPKIDAALARGREVRASVEGVVAPARGTVRLRRR